MRPIRRLAPLALVSALTLTLACNKDPEQPSKSDSGPGETDKPAPTPASTPTPTSPATKPAVTAPTHDSQPATNVEGIVATVQIPTGTAMRDLAAVVDNMKPGTSMLLTMQAPTLLGEALGMDLSGAKLDRPLALVVVDPISNPKPLALLVEIADAAKLAAAAEAAGLSMREREGKALLGPAAVVDKTEAFAFANLVTQPDHSEVVIYPKTMLAALGPKLDEGIAELNAAMAQAPAGPAAGKMVGMYIDMLRSMTAQTDRVVISVAASEASSDVFMRLYPTAGTTLAAFVAAQATADHALLSKLPGTAPAPFVMSGNMQAGDARTAMIDWSIEFMQSFYTTNLTAEQWRTLLGNWLATFDGNFAVAVEMDISTPTAPKMTMRGLMGSTDANAMRSSWREMATIMTQTGTTEMLGMKFSMSFSPDALEHDGVPVDLFRTAIDVSSLPPEQQAAMAAAGADQAIHMATFDQVAVLASADPENANVKAAIDAARGKGPTLQPSPALVTALADSKAQGESFVYHIDVAGFLPPEAKASGEVPFSAVILGMGKHGDALSMRVSLHK